jgi:GMP synthase (glutamine-hydrolysing)
VPKERSVVRSVVILRAGDAVAEVRAVRGDFPAWIRESGGDAWSGEWVAHDVRSDEALPEIRRAAAFVITGSSSSVTERAPWMLRAEEYVREIVAAKVPLLGICFGHQLMGQALGGLVAKNPRGRELGSVLFESSADAHEEPLLRGLPPEFTVNASHVDSVVRLPDGARVLGKTAKEPLSAFAVRPCAWGVQFHPEFDGDVVRGYVKARATAMRSEGLSPDAALERAADAPHGREVLRNFLRTIEG